MPEMPIEEVYDLLLKKQAALEEITEKLEELTSKEDELELDKYLEEVEKLHLRSEILVKELEELGPTIKALDPENDET